MGLVLSLRSGHDVYVGGSRVVVSWIDNSYRFGLKLPDGSGVTVTSDRWTDIFDGVKVQAGTPRNQDAKTLVRLVIDAPGIEIVRGDVFRRDTKSPKAAVCETCNGSKKLTTVEPCSRCNGAGCASCTAGQVKVEFVCPDCSTEED